MREGVAAGVDALADRSLDGGEFLGAAVDAGLGAGTGAASACWLRW